VEASDIFRQVAYIGYVVLAINFLVYFKSYRKESVAFKIFTYYLLFCLLVQVLTSGLRFFKIYNLFLSHFYFIGQFLLLSIFFKKILQGKILNNIISYLAFIPLAFSILYHIQYPSKFFQFNIYEIIITSIPLVIYSFIFFFQRVGNSEGKFLFVISGFLLYTICSTLLFATGNIEASIKKYIWYCNVSLYLVYQILIFIEWYKHFRKPEVQS